jgi:hypothetical protein
VLLPGRQQQPWVIHEAKQSTQLGFANDEKAFLAANSNGVDCSNNNITEFMYRLSALCL